MRNYIQPGNAITVTAAAAAQSGDGVLVGALFGIASGNAEPGDKLVLATTGVFELPKVATDDISVGEPIYWDGTAGDATLTASGNTLIGHAVAAAGNPSATVKVRLSI